MPARPMPNIEQDHNHGDFGATAHASAPEATSTAAARIEASAKLPDA